MSEFDYDPNGNRVWEHYRSTVGAGVLFQASTAKYDNLNRLISVSDPGRYEIKYAYDANGNRTWLRSGYTDGLGRPETVQEYYYKYDALNRFRVTMGQLVGNTVVAGSGGDGVAIEYDEVGQRKTATYAYDGHVEAYTYDSLNRLETTTIDGTLRSRRSYDLGGRATGYVQYTDTGSARSSITREFDDDNRLKKETDTVTGRGTDYFYGLDGTLASTKTFGDATTQTSTYSYEWWDDAKRKSTKLEASNNQYVAWNPGFTKFWYDANGNVKGALDEIGGRTFEYMTTANGQVLQRYEMLGGRYDETLGRVLDSKQNRHHGFFHFDGKRIGNVGNDGIEREDYVQQMSRVRDAEVSPDSKYRQYTPVAGADFDENYLPINASYPDIAPGRYTVRAGDTLRSVARTLWGDGAMWYLLAQANGLQIQPEAALKEFTTLTVPNVVTNFHNTSETNRVYNAAWALGDTSPSLPAPQLPPPQSSGGCGGFGRVLMIVVAVAATVYTAGAVSVGLTTALQSGVAATMTQGAGVLSGALLSASPGMSLAASAAGGAAGSVASQAVGIATGQQQDFSWRQVAMSAVGSMVSSSIGPGAIGTNPLGMSPYQAAAARAAFTSTSLQAISMASGQQGRFNWRAVAASAVGAGLGQGAQVGFGAQAAPSALSRALGETFGEVGRGTVFGMMSGAAAGAIGSGRVMARQVAVDAFGNALGNSLVAGRGAPTPGGSGLRASQEQVEAWGPQYRPYDTSGPTDYSPTAGGPLPRLSTAAVDPMPVEARAVSNAMLDGLMTVMGKGRTLPNRAQVPGPGGDATLLYAEAGGGARRVQDDTIMARRGAETAWSFREAGMAQSKLDDARKLDEYRARLFSLGQGVSAWDGVLRRSPAETFLLRSGAYERNAGTVEAHIGPVVGPAVALAFGGTAALVVRGGFAASGAYDIGYGGAAVADGNYADGGGRIGAGLLSLAGATTPIRAAKGGLFGTAPPFSLDMATVERIRGLPVGERPSPSTYMPLDVIETQLSRFDSGASRFTTQSTLEKYGPAQRDGTAFVITRGEADRLVNASAGNARAMEEALGLPKGLLDSTQLVRVDISRPRDLGLRVPSGNEAGVNSLWRPGGRLPNGSVEAVIDLGGVPASRYSTTRLRF